jgi:MazG family protein
VETGKRFEEFIAIVKKLRRECPWDREQTLESLKPYLVEEVYEALQAIDSKDYKKLKEEVGDMLLHVVMLSVFAAETKKFNIDRVIRTIAAKMIRRHPHVFAKGKARSKEEVWRRWEKIKGRESRVSSLASIPQALPALYRADKVQRRAARVGFDWDRVAGAWEKVHEELDEVHQLLGTKVESRKVKEEIGDLLFAVTNVARKLNIDAEEALQQANNKFIRRYAQIEKRLLRKKMTLREMDALWDKVKAAEK